ncbi:hypothetical protein M0R45_021138 [Rubus argutus]|uniref:Uncharacterized protein n=1 Tax=Rubus argutus TaxID=59490 RepID=A0AAW1XC67_RUBAR
MVIYGRAGSTRRDGDGGVLLGLGTPAYVTRRGGAARLGQRHGPERKCGSGVVEQRVRWSRFSVVSTTGFMEARNERRRLGLLSFPSRSGLFHLFLAFLISCSPSSLRFSSFSQFLGLSLF